MRSLILTVLLAAIVTVSPAQQFFMQNQIVLPDTLEHVLPEWIDLNNDGLLDNLLLAENKDGEHFLLFVEGDTVNAPMIHPNKMSVPEFISYRVYDYNRDNDMDLVVTEEGGVTVVYENTGDFTFQRSVLNLPPFKMIRFADLDGDATRDCVLSGTMSGVPFTQTWKQVSEYNWTMTADTLQAELSGLEIVDLDQDGFDDVFMSGRVNPDSVFSIVLEKENDRFLEKLKTELLANAHVSDVDGDGFRDIVATGLNEYSNQAKLFQFKNGTWVTSDYNLPSNVISFEMFDLNSDGKSDKSMLLSDGANQKTHIVQFDNGTETLLFSGTSYNMSFGDRENDGDLDLIAITNNGQPTLNFQRNETSSVNQPPSGPRKALVIPIYESVLLYWQKAVDDHTSQNQLTYDLHIESNNTLQAAQFDLTNFKRLVPSHGNNGSINFKFIPNPSSPVERFAVQSVDNALHAGSQGTCVGAGVSCIQLKEVTLSLCSNEVRNLSASSNALWFSLKDGYLGEGASIPFEATAKDTLFAFEPDFVGCSIVTSYIIAIDNNIRPIAKENLYSCNGKTLLLEGVSQEGKWTSGQSGNLGMGTLLNYEVKGGDVINQEFTNNEGCNIKKQFTIFLSIPNVKADPAEIITSPNLPVQLSASGASTYNWTPNIGLSDPFLPNPIATIDSDMIYTVTGTDSVGCTWSASVRIRVQSNGFIPSLFTPNADGKNDALKIFGLENPDRFLITVLNRSGQIVYSTNSVSAATAEGWDGKTNGSLQPAGVYFWRVEGSLASGEKVLLNGKQEGAVLLIR